MLDFWNHLTPQKRLLYGLAIIIWLLIIGICAWRYLQPAATVSNDSEPVTSTEAADTPAPDAPEASTSNATAAVLADDTFSNLQLTDPTLPVYDTHTRAERQQQGLPTALPQLKPYHEGKVVYLTFDDGPDGVNTPAILNILRDNHVPATFYVLGKAAAAHPDMVQRMFAEHHAIGNHSYDHDYGHLYASHDAFLQEMAKTDDIIKSIIGVRPLILRAPGGIIGHFGQSWWPTLPSYGYVEHDWNVSSADAAPNHPVAQNFIDNINYGTDQPVAAHTAIILMHCSDGHEETVKALPEIIRILREKGYTFGVITPMTPQPW